MWLGLDLGTGSVKALLLDGQGTVVGEASTPYTVDSPFPGYAESEPQTWWRATGAASRQAVAGRGKEVKAVGLSGQMHGVVVADDAAVALRPAILWADTRSRAELDRYRQLPSSLSRVLGNPLAVGMAGPSLLWLKSHEPNVYKRAAWALQPKDWLRANLTGAFASEPSDASATLLYDIHRDTWALETIRALDLRTDWLPPLLASQDVAGTLTPTAAVHLGLLPGTPVAAGGGDTAVAALGSGLLEPGSAQLTVGTGAQIVALRDRPRPDRRRRTHLYRAVTDKHWYSLAAIQNAGLALEWVRRMLGYPDWSSAYQEAFSAEPGCAGLTFLPYLSGERTPHMDPEVRGAWSGIGLSHGRGHLMRAAFEGVAYSVRDGLDALAGSSVRTQELRLGGGGTLDPRWQQLLADVLGCELAVSTVSAASARGAALLASIAVGAFPDASATAFLTPKIARRVEPGQADERLEAGWQRYRALYAPLRRWNHKDWSSL